MKNGRNTAGQFSAGNSGRPKGSRNKATLAIESLLQGQAEALTQTAVTKALEGDSVALRLCMDRIAPAPKDAAVNFYCFSPPKLCHYLMVTGGFKVGTETVFGRRCSKGFA